VNNFWQSVTLRPYTIPYQRALAPVPSVEFVHLPWRWYWFYKFQKKRLCSPLIAFILNVTNIGKVHQTLNSREIHSNIEPILSLKKRKQVTGGAWSPKSPSELTAGLCLSENEVKRTWLNRSAVTQKLWIWKYSFVQMLYLYECLSSNIILYRKESTLVNASSTVCPQ
jgi:hypothetical protein